jgi:hypothetical protein
LAVADVAVCQCTPSGLAGQGGGKIVGGVPAELIAASKALKKGASND